MALFFSLICALLGLSAAAVLDAASLAGSRQLEATKAQSTAGDVYSKLVLTSSSKYGKLKKQEVLPLDRWVNFNHTSFREFLLQTQVLKQKLGKPGPMAYRCGVFVNHAYKAIFIRNRKSASTTVLDQFKIACKTQDRKFCFRPFSTIELQEAKITAEEMWRTYWVFTTIRNPFARAVSGYDYVLDRWPNREGVCKDVPFEHFCANPYHLGILGNLFRCGTQSSFREEDAWAYDFYHVEPAFHCLTGATGKVAVDFLIRYEHLHDDYVAMVDAFNARKPSGLPPLESKKLRWMKQGVHVQSAKEAVGGMLEEIKKYVPSDRHAVRYRTCGPACVRGIAGFFQQDLDTFKFEIPPLP